MRFKIISGFLFLVVLFSSSLSSEDAQETAENQAHQKWKIQVGQFKLNDWALIDLESCLDRFSEGTVYVDGTKIDHPLFLELNVDASVFNPNCFSDSHQICVTDKGVTITGMSESGVAMGIYTFLSDYCGFFWLTPDERDFIIADSEDLFLSSGNQQYVPDFRSRYLYGSNVPDIWAFRNRLIKHDEFIHGLQTLVADSDYDDSPFLFPVIDGKRFEPGNDLGPYQPDIATEEVSRFIANKVAVRFRETGSYVTSIAQVDGGVYGESDELKRQLNPRKFYTNRPDYSDLVFGFSNRVAGIISEEFDDFRLGILAYRWTENAPSFQLHESLNPYLARDRSQRYDNDFADEDRLLMHRWANSGVRHLGLYDYQYGETFFMPRYALQFTDEYIQEAKQLGFDGYFAELLPVWPYDALKAWVLTRLVWDVNEDIEKLKSKFNEMYYGSASTYITDYFSIWEHVWVTQGAEARWLKYYVHPGQASLVNEATLSQLSDILNQALSEVQDGAYKRRLQQLKAVHDITVSFIETYHKWVELTTVSDEQLPQAYRQWVHSRKESRVFLETGNMHDISVPTSWHTMLAYMSRADFVLIRLTNALAEGRIAPTAVSDIELLEPHKQGTVFWLVRDGGFEFEKLPTSFNPFAHPLDSPIKKLGDWDISARPSDIAKAVITDEERADGEYSLKCSSVGKLCLTQSVRLSSGRKYLATLQLKGKISSGSALVLAVKRPEDAGYVREVAMMPEGDYDEWTTLACIFEASDSLVKKTAELSVEILWQQTGEELLIDNIQMREIY